MELFTVGHSNYSIEAFIALLQQHGVTALADVRSHPYSRYLPHFNQASLKTTARDAGIRYVFLGRELGARPSDRTCYVDGKALYEKIASTRAFSDGIERILKGTKTYKIAMMCAEKDPITCHRAILVCQHLREFNLEISHIMKNGELETHHHLEERLLKLHELNLPQLPEAVQLTLFSNVSPQPTSNRSKEDLLIEAYKRQGNLIAYTEKQESSYEQVS